MTDQVKVAIGGKKYAISLPLSIGQVLGAADAIVAYGAAIERYKKREPGMWRAARVDAMGAAIKIVSVALVSTAPDLTQEEIRKRAVASADPAVDEGTGILAAATEIVARSGYFEDPASGEAGPAEEPAQPPTSEASASS